QEARVLFDRAREVAKNGNAKLAVTTLKKVTTGYPNTRAAADAREALDRPARNLPLFLDRPAGRASEADEKPAAGAAPPAAPAGEALPKVVRATPSGVPAVKGAEAAITLPANAPEPSRTPAVTTPAAPERPSRPLPKGFYARSGARVHESGWPLEILGERD